MSKSKKTKSGESKGSPSPKITSICIAIPCTSGSLPLRFVMSLSAMMYPQSYEALGQLGVKRINVFFNPKFPIDVNRNECCKFAIDNDYDALIFLDIDQHYPVHTLKMLIEAANKKHGDVIGSLYFKKKYPHQPVPATWWRDNPKSDQIMVPVDIFKRDENSKAQGLKKELIKADVIGMGGTLIPTSVLKRLKKPYFKYIKHYETGELEITEDVYFCRQLDEHAAIWVDPRIECGHLMTQEIDSAVWSQLEDKLQQPTEDYLQYGKQFFDHPHNKTYMEEQKNYDSLSSYLLEISGEKDCKIVDVGCGLGCQIKSLKGFYSRIIGIDASQYAVNKCVKAGLNVMHSDSQHLHIALNGDKPDIIFCSELLEHLTEKDIIDTLKSFNQTSAKIFFGTINLKDQFPTHYTLKNRAWWNAQFSNHGWKPDPIALELTCKDKEANLNRDIFVYRRSN